jgi:hypothetical protein
MWLHRTVLVGAVSSVAGFAVSVVDLPLLEAVSRGGPGAHGASSHAGVPVVS